ncbi:hypothetical protein Tco_1002912, partial [Tanacetum coccineum]
GMLEERQEITVKCLSQTSSQGIDEFKNEVICISKLQHDNTGILSSCLDVVAVEMTSLHGGERRLMICQPVFCIERSEGVMCLTVKMPRNAFIGHYGFYRKTFKGENVLEPGSLEAKNRK